MTESYGFRSRWHEHHAHNCATPTAAKRNELKNSACELKRLAAWLTYHHASPQELWPLLFCSLTNEPR